MSRSVMVPLMPKKPAPQGSEAPKPPKITTRVAADVARMARILADDEGIDLYDYLDAILRPVVAERYQQFVRREGKKLD